MFLVPTDSDRGAVMRLKQGVSVEGQGCVVINDRFWVQARSLSLIVLNIDTDNIVLWNSTAV